ncbi:acyloxyacyl hydrolase [Autumnicola psychrophila]|uniref:Acyloxyacyl hydrolase n=1 Tax=Autumnicola psychrophila TaxID=3075592 RepID=A0ABU3DNE7_9FLAO|nr:acyloxyacyl hydrolase [Zunongwangia sp. F225]MDT0685049.1 acyloxyacyl hydrolase [Zunongwangia sp. F225]
MNKFVLYLLLFCCGIINAQDKASKFYSVDANYFYGTILEHSPDISHLITDHPTGIILSFQRKTYGFKAWERRYNHPDVGYSFTYQDLKNQHLGENFGLYAHLSFYFLQRNLMFRVGQGLAYASNPYHPDDNYRNNAYGSQILSSTYLMGNFHRENIYKGFGLQAGISLLHYSNADFKSPNSSTNTLTFNVGVNYMLDYENAPEYIAKDSEKIKYSEPVHLNFAVRGGVNTMGIIGSARYPFLTATVFADKVINRKSTLQAGAEFFYSKALEEYIYYQSVAFPNGHTTGDEDANRVGLFAGHQLTFNKLSVITQLGFYVYYPYAEYVDQLYIRAGLSRKLSEHFWASATVRAHGANAEAVEFSLGYRL